MIHEIRNTFRGILADLRKSDHGVLFRRRFWNIRGRLENLLWDDATFIRRTYHRTNGDVLNLLDPRKFTEKLQWLKLFYRDDLMTVCSDKYEVRKYVTQKGYDHLLNDVIGIYSSFEDIDLESLPNRFVLKATHGSGWNLIVRDKGLVNWRIWRKIAKVWLDTDLSWFGREWNYHFLKRRLVIEEYLEDDSGELRDFKIMCFNGQPMWMQIDENRTSCHKRAYLDMQGHPIPMTDLTTGSKPNLNKFELSPSWTSTHRRMIEIASDLCEPFVCVRVDFYAVGERIVFGELTFFDGSGFYALSPDKYDLHYGNLLELPEPNFNLELIQQLKASR